MTTAIPAFRLRARGPALALLLAAALGGCALPAKPQRPALYDFGPGPLSAPAAAQAAKPPLVLTEVEAPAALDSGALLYRLAYADAQQLRPYAQARWTMPPAQLLRQRLREALSRQRPVLNAGEGGAALLLRVELEEFSQLFEAPERSQGLVRLRASLLETQAGREQLLAQRSVVVQRPAASADAPGGVRALTEATDAAVEELLRWLEPLR
ncbi:ABC-type transport auxiliary lipoprotein family protein [Ramlibacter sp. 2FC]|uniref:ABC-type transport auxiliary lipoprotein family protein n=1 Tax=Ramlibacter sp. 2FC TaxID=2502188 RepID=UPI00201E5EEE|nr:ABC-type transport auxiliary lipoprotein family protein [Ramlibacter sp. 2FC]